MSTFKAPAPAEGLSFVDALEQVSNSFTPEDWAKIGSLAKKHKMGDVVTGNAILAKFKPPADITLPTDERGSLEKFYGKPGAKGGPEPEKGLTWFSWPYDGIRLYSPDGPALRDRDGDGRDDHRCHSMIARQLTSALKAAYDHFGKVGFEKIGANIYGGCYNARPMRGNKSKLSTHSWGISIDLDPLNNPMSRTGTANCNFPDEFLDLMECFGFLSLYRAYSNDAMHFQAAIPSYIEDDSYYGRNGLPAWIRQA